MTQNAEDRKEATPSTPAPAQAPPSPARRLAAAIENAQEAVRRAREDVTHALAMAEGRRTAEDWTRAERRSAGRASLVDALVELDLAAGDMKVVGPAADDQRKADAAWWDRLIDRAVAQAKAAAVEGSALGREAGLLSAVVLLRSQARTRAGRCGRDATVRALHAAARHLEALAREAALAARKGGAR